MYSLWFLLAILLAASMYSIWRIRRPAGPEFSDNIPLLPPKPTLCEVGTKPAAVQTRVMRRISIGEFMTVLANDRDVLLIDLRPDALEVPLPVSNATILPTALDELAVALESIPAGRSVAFCGASDVCIYLIATSPCMEGSAPLYVLEGDLRLAEVA